MKLNICPFLHVNVFLVKKETCVGTSLAILSFIMHYIKHSKKIELQRRLVK